MLICLHGLSASSRWWRRVLPPLETIGPVTLLDLPRRMRPAGLPEWVAGRLETLDTPVDVAGHSLGGLVAVQLAATRPELVRRLVLIAPPGLHSHRSPLGYAWPLVSSLARSRPQLLARLTADALRAGPANLVRGSRHVTSIDASPYLARVRAPTLLVWGERDRVVPSDAATLWTDRLPNARLVLLPRAAHVPMFEAPDELAAAIAGFLQEDLDQAADLPRP